MPVHDQSSPAAAATPELATTATPAPQLATAAPTVTAAAIDEKVVANAVDKLLAKSPTAQASVDAAIVPGTNPDSHQHKKIIAPLAHPEEPSLQELLAKEEAKEVGNITAPTTPAAAASPTAEAALSNEEAEAAALLAKAQADATNGSTQTTDSAKPADNQKFDPNSISL